ncbi:MAG: DNA internalization-related competence protein ComEC/Rec2 [Planctomycetaceae bacterium]
MIQASKVQDRPSEVREHAPAMVVSLAFGLGILCDRWADWTWTTLIGISVLLTVGILLLIRLLPSRDDSSRLLMLAGLLLCGCCGALRHHACWSVRSPTDISTFASEAPAVTRVVGRVVGPPTRIETPDDSMTPEWMRVDRTIGLLECETIDSVGREIPVTGTIRFDVTGHLMGVAVGDRVAIYGSLRRPAAPRNPQVNNYRDWLRIQGIDVLLSVDHPDHLLLLPSEQGLFDRLQQVRSRLRDGAVGLLQEQLSDRSFPVAVSLLMGDRSYLSEETRTAFIESGTMHLLAISGLHIGILAALLHLICRLCQLSPRAAALTTLLGIICYAMFTDHRPPVMRATVLAGVVLLGTYSQKRTNGYQLLGLSALILMIYRPVDLFDVGAQLSFLAILGIVWSNRLLKTRELQRSLQPPPPQSPHWLRYVGEIIFQTLISAYVMSAAIWLFTLPLTAHQFQIVSPIGFAVNALLIPFVALILAAGYLTLLCGLLFPFLTGLFAPLFDSLLSGLLMGVEGSAALEYGHFAVNGPTLWWLVGYYVLLISAIGLVRLPVSPTWCWKGIVVWIGVGLTVPLLTPKPDGLTLQFLAVGHGGCLIVRTPNGQVLMYDCGAITGGDRVAKVARGALRELGVSRVDGLVISHADIDHYSGVSKLSEAVPIRAVCFSQQFLDFKQRAVKELCESLAEARIPLRIVQEGDRLRIDPEVLVEVLHPSARFEDSQDNAHSIVLRLTFAGRSILLTGDLEGAGLPALWDQQDCRADVVTAPHHGSIKANPVELGRRINPKYVIVCASPGESSDRLAQQYPETSTILSTGDVGAITVHISPAGELEVTTFLPRKNLIGAVEVE